MKLYLAGPINGCTDAEALDWRDEATVALTASGHTLISPMSRDYRGREMDPGIAAEIVEGDKADIDASDIVLANCPRPSYGTAMEVIYAWEQGKRVVVVCDRPSPWLLYHSEAVVPTLAEALALLA